MANFSVKNNAIQDSAGQLEDISRDLQNIEMEIAGIRGSLGFEVASANAIRSRLGKLSQNIQTQRKNTRSMALGLRQTAQKYRTTENRICGHTKAEKGLKGIIGQALCVFPGANPEFFKDKFASFWNFMDQFWPSSGSDPGTGSISWPELLLTAPSAIQGLKDWAEGFEDDIKDGIVDATSVSGSAKGEWELWGAGVEGKYGSAGVTALAAEAYASGSAGLFTKDEDGNLLFNPNIDAKIGASVTALHLDAEGHVGNDMLGASGNVTADIGKVAAVASATAGMFNEKGELDPRMKVKASAEAIAIEAKGEAGVTVLGTEAKVSGSVNVGVGAHADVGYEDGKLSFDIGASLGVGVSVGFEVDIGGTVDAVKDFAKSVLPWF